MAANPADVLAGLPELTWRGLSAPASYAHVDFKLTQAELRYPYVDVGSHDYLGRDPHQFAARLYFLNTVQPDSFPKLFGQWWKNLTDGSSGQLHHPVLGKVRARVLSGHVAIAAEVRAGCIVDVAFTETRDDIASPIKFNPTEVSLESAAKAATAACATFGINYPDGENKTDLFGAFNAFMGSLFSASLTVGGAINTVIGNVTTMIEAVDALNDAAAWPAYDMLTSVYSSLHDLKAASDKLTSRAVAGELAASTTTLDAFATAKGMTTEEAMGLNLAALRAPVVAKGTKLFYYTGR